jgi:hypothetical protein
MELHAILRRNGWRSGGRPPRGRCALDQGRRRCAKHSPAFGRTSLVLLRLAKYRVCRATLRNLGPGAGSRSVAGSPALGAIIDASATKRESSSCAPRHPSTLARRGRRFDLRSPGVGASVPARERALEARRDDHRDPRLCRISTVHADRAGGPGDEITRGPPRHPRDPRRGVGLRVHGWPVGVPSCDRSPPRHPKKSSRWLPAAEASRVDRPTALGRAESASQRGEAMLQVRDF